jgi:hypothetical protein
MAQITLDSALASKLDGLNDVVELRDPSGRILGRFVPALELDLSEWEPISPDVSAEELECSTSSGTRAPWMN